MYKGIIHKYKEYLPVTDKTPIITLHEGNTPLIEAPRLSKEINALLKIYLKFEGMNPTGSFKDRGMTMAVSKAVEEGSKALICASTGNTSASASAYAACAGLKSFVLLPEGKVAFGKLAQALIHGAKVIAIDGNFDDALRCVREVAEDHPVTIVNSINPYRTAGQKTTSFEICDFLGDSPHFHALPVGNARNIYAYWEGFKEYHCLSKSTRLPKMLGFQAAGSAPLVDGHIIEKPETIATAIRIGNPASWDEAMGARDQSHGLIDKVTDEEILYAYQMVASLEGVFCEPASAAPLAGLIKLTKMGYFKEASTVTISLTGHGLKDPDTAIKVATHEPLKAKATKESVLEALDL